MSATESRDDAVSHKVELITAGIDWLTCTLSAEYQARELWVGAGLAVLDRIGEQGYDIVPRSMQGYYGASAGNCFVGSRDDGSMIQLTGYHANDWFSYVYRPGVHVSRLDVQMTTKYEVMPNDIAKRAYEGATVSNTALPAHRRRKLYIISGSDGGDTFYLGAPSSEQRGRIYNKEVQSEDISYRRTWRYEVVYRNDLATQLSERCPIPQDKRAEWAAKVVCSWFGTRGVSCSGHDDIDAAVLPLAKTLPNDIERSLLWLERQVAPTIRRLTEAGYRDTILTRLGLADE